MSLRLAEAGMKLVLADVDDEAMAEVADAIAAADGQAIAVHTDVADGDANRALFDAALAVESRYSARRRGSRDTYLCPPFG